MNTKECESCIRCILCDAMKMFCRLAGKKPTRILIPENLEKVMDHYRMVEHGMAKTLREEGVLLGLEVVFDVPDFGLE